MNITLHIERCIVSKQVLAPLYIKKTITTIHHVTTKIKQNKQSTWATTLTSPKQGGGEGGGGG